MNQLWCRNSRALKRHKYFYADSLANSQEIEWTLTSDKAGRITKEYYPYEIAVDGSDIEYTPHDG